MVTSLLRVVVCALMCAAVALTGMPAASAHTALISSDPAADTALTAGPAAVSATFNEDLQPSFAAMTVVGPDANLWSVGDPEVSGAVVSVPVRPLGPSGKYTVNYRVTSADGHVVSGSWSFTLTTATAAAPGPPAATDAPATRIPLWPFIVGIGVLVAAAAAWGLRRRS